MSRRTLIRLDIHYLANAQVAARILAVMRTAAIVAVHMNGLASPGVACIAVNVYCLCARAAVHPWQMEV